MRGDKPAEDDCALERLARLFVVVGRTLVRVERREGYHVVHQGAQLTLLRQLNEGSKAILIIFHFVHQSPSTARGLRYRKWPFGMTSEVF